MRVLLSILAAGAAIGLVLFALGVFDETSAPEEDGRTEAAPAPTPTDGGGTTLGGDPVPAEEPTYDIRPFEAPVGVLMLSERPTSWSVFVRTALHDAPELRYATWYTESSQAQDLKAGPGPGVQRGMELKGQPTAVDLGKLDIEVLIVDTIDPNALPGVFWDEVSKRVASGDMGLWVRPGFPVGAAGEARTAHPMLSHPALSALLPVAEAQQLEGSPVPGTFQKGATLAVTDAGARHPATRITPYVKWSHRFWERRAEGEFAWKPAFCYPVSKLAARAVSLVDVQVTPIDRSPAIAVSSPDVGRVLWQGNFDFGHRTYYSAEGTGPLGVLMNRMVLWLAGRGRP